MTSSQPLGSRFDRALHLATELHREQCRKGSQTPYIAHLLAVCAIVLENGGDEDQAIAALLHDAMEDQGGRPTLDRIRDQFGDRVARIVEECSDSDAVDPEKKSPWQQRKQDYIDHLPKLSADARLISLADKLHNVRSILEDFRRDGESVWSRFNGKRDGTLWYYQSLRDQYQHSGNSALSRQFVRLVDELLSEASASPR